VNERDKSLLRQWAVSRPPSFYVNHPNADRAAERILMAIDAAPDVTPSGARATFDGPLTVRQLQVIGGKASGLTDVRIADLLGISTETVKFTAKKAYDRLGIEKRPGCERSVAAVACAIRSGWL